MESTRVPSMEWASIVLRAVGGSDGSRQAVLGAVCAELKVHPEALPMAAAFAESLVELVAYATTPDAASVDSVDLETEAVEASRLILRPLLQAKMQAHLDALDEELLGQAQCPSCGRSAESQGRLTRTWSSLFGGLMLRRRYRYCEDCDEGSAPAQRLLGLPEGAFTARLEEACTMMTTTVSHGMAQELLSKLLGVEVSIKALEDMTERRGSALQAVQAVEAKQCAAYEESGLSVPQQTRPTDAVAEVAAPEVAYMEADGVMALTRRELTGEELTAADEERQRRAKEEKAQGGKGRRYETTGREVKNAVLYKGDACAKESSSRGCILEKTYVSHLGDWLFFVTLLWAELLRLRFDKAKLLVILSDGAEWIRSIAKWLPIPTFLILDLYHVNRRIWEVARSLYGDHTVEATQWAKVQCARVEAGQARDVITALGFLHPDNEETRKLVESLAGFLTNNLDRIDYPAYRARGLRISSATIESANFHVSGQRLKVQGTRWSDEGAGHMASLRADLFNGRWERRTKELLAMKAA